MAKPAPFTPEGLQFFDVASARRMMLVEQPGSPWDGWLCYLHPDGQWVSLRVATAADRAAIDAAMARPPTIYFGP